MNQGKQTIGVTQPNLGEIGVRSPPPPPPKKDIKDLKESTS